MYDTKTRNVILATDSIKKKNAKLTKSHYKNTTSISTSRKIMNKNKASK